MKGKLIGLVLFVIFSSFLSAQSLFKDAEASSKKEEKPYELNGYLRSVLFVGKVADVNEAELKSGYGEASLKLKVRKKSFGDAFAEIRFLRGYEFKKSVSEINIRETYLNVYAGLFDFRIGQQIVAWGRADGVNPTDNITPKNLLVRSPDEDDRRQSNFLIRSHYNLHPLRIEAIWVPAYESSYIPTDLLSFPPGVMLIDPDYPDARVKNSAFAVRLNLEMPSLDGSISYFNGHNPFPGISANILALASDNLFIEVFPKSYRLHILGADFQTTAGSYGLRGELAYRKPHEDHERYIHIPNPDLQYVLGIDKEFSGNFSVILQYIGKYVFDFKELEKPLHSLDIPYYELAQKNRLITSQQYKLSHSLSFRIEQKMLHETMSVEVLGLVHITSDEFLLRAKLTYDLTDAFNLTVGGEVYVGQENTLFDTIDSTLNSVFVELRAFF